MKVENKTKPELLAPAGNLEKMKIALEFGADAVYFGLPDFSLRMRVNQFGEKEIKQAAEFCKKKKKKFYVTLNIYAHERHLKQLPKHLELIEKIEPDGVIVSDPGILSVIKRQLPDQEIHLSTQANATNSEAVKFWGQQGVARVILAREVTLEEIKTIKKQAADVELEVFVHGAMCMSYSGRCILSKWMTNRSANLGDCAQPCRWRYRQVPSAKCKVQNEQEEEKNEDEEVLKMSVVDDKDRFGVDLEEDQHGTYFFNSYDMCLVEHVNELIDAGVDSLKIEGRAKSVYYVAVATRAYRKAIDSAGMLSRREITQKKMQQIVAEQKKQLEKLSHRGYGAGFLLGEEPEHLFDKAYMETQWEFVGISDEDKKSKTRKIFVHNSLKVGDEVDAVGIVGDLPAKVEKILDDQGEEVDSAHGGLDKTFEVTFSKPVEGLFLLRKKQKEISI